MIQDTVDSTVFLFFSLCYGGNKKNEQFRRRAPPASVPETSRTAKSVWFLSHSCQPGQRATSISRSATLRHSVSLPSSSSEAVEDHEDPGTDGWTDSWTSGRCVKEKYNRRPRRSQTASLARFYPQKRNRSRLA